MRINNQWISNFIQPTQTQEAAVESTFILSYLLQLLHWPVVLRWSILLQTYKGFVATFPVAGEDKQDFQARTSRTFGRGRVGLEDKLVFLDF